jgi:ribonuclease G
MSKDLIVNRTLNEMRVALLQNGEILDYLLERGDPSDESGIPRVGNIYKGKVIRVLPGMQSAFVDIGVERAAFLYVDDAYIPTLEEQRAVQAKKELAAEAVKDQWSGEVIPDEMSTLKEAVALQIHPDVKIENVLKEGQEVIVQISKEPIATKGARVTRQITLAGRYIVFMPFIEHVGVSRRIENEPERDRLKKVLEGMRADKTGLIGRTVAEGQSHKTLKSDHNMLVKIWQDVGSRVSKAKAPSLLYKDLSSIERVMRDIADEDLDNMVVDSKEDAKLVEKFVSKYFPLMKGKVTIHTADTPILEHYGIEIELERALSNKVYLKSGGSINIDQTEALVSIDVNTGKFVGRKTLDETILQTNLEAVKEISYQLRVRNCGGIIIIDFIDMEKVEHRTMVYQALLEALKKDRSKTNVLPISGLGLVEMTRKRTRETLTRVMCSPCPYCEGSGRVKNVDTVCYEIIRELFKSIRKSQSKKIHIYAHPEVSARLCSEEFEIIDLVEETFGKSLIIRSENSYHIEQYDIDKGVT